jgi:hypothetical protein
MRAWLQPLCTLWALNQCSKKGIECKGRHYYGSAAEKQKSLDWATQTIHRMERPILESVTMREQLLGDAREASKEADARFAAHTHKVRLEDVAPVLDKLDQLRVATVQVLECIARWQQHVKAEHLASHH